MSTATPAGESDKSTSGGSDDVKSGNANTLMNGRGGRNSGSGSKKSPIKNSTADPQNCTWCSEAKTPLKYVLPTQTGKKEFCSETCIAEFRKAYSKGACIECDNALRGTGPNREFCSTYCLNKHNKKKSASGQQTPSTSTTTTGTQKSTNNNNNSSIANNNKQKETNNNNTASIKEHYAVTTTTTKMSPMFQYEAFHVFDWKDYLKVSQLSPLVSLKLSRCWSF